MAIKTITKAKFAELAGVNASTVTRVCKTILEPAMVGKRIDVCHALAVDYIEKQKALAAKLPGNGIDPLYEEALYLCRDTGRWNASFLRQALKVGARRSNAIFAMIQAAGLIPELESTVEQPPKVKVIPEGVSAVRKRPGGAAVNEAKKRAADADSEIIEVPENIQAFLHMTLHELIEKFGTDIRFLDWLKATNSIEVINERRLKNAKTKGELISRQLVKTGVIDVFNSAHLRLMKDGAKSIAAGVISKHSAGAELSAVEAFVSDILGSFIKPVKNKIARSLKDTGESEL